MTNKQANTELALQNLYALREEYADGEQEYLDMLDQIKNTLTINAQMLEALRDCRVAVKTGCTEHALAFIEKAIAAAEKGGV